MHIIIVPFLRTGDEMKNKITHSELFEYLEALKLILSRLDYSVLYNVIFLNMEAFYSYLDKFRDEKDASVSEMITGLEPYIPLTLCTDKASMDLLMQATITADQEELSRIEKSFYSRARLEFLNAIKNAATEESWNQILSLCSNMYQMS